MASGIRIGKALIFIGAAAFISNILFLSDDISTPPQPSTNIQRSPEPAAPHFKPTADMRAALDPGESFRSDGWRFEFGDFSERTIKVWAYWPNDLQATEQAVEIMSKAMVSDTVKRLHEVGFDSKANGTNITYFFRKEPIRDKIIMLGSAGYMGILDEYYFTAP